LIDVPDTAREITLVPFILFVGVVEMLTGVIGS